MTLAIAKWLCEDKTSKDVLIKNLKYFGNRYPNAGYGGMFYRWLDQESPEPYGSWANGSAMRVSPCAWVADSLEEAQELAKTSAIVTHNHPDGVIGALATSDAIYLARIGASKDEIREHIEVRYDYNLSLSLDEIRPSYKFEISCKKSVPESIICFLEAKDFEGFKMGMITTFGCESPFEEGYFLQERQRVLVDKLFPIVYDHYKAKLQKISEQAYPVIERVYLEHGDRFQNIAIPFTDGKKTINIVAPLKKCYETQGREVGLSFEKGITLAVIDNAWKEHLRAMDDLKESVQNASYEQKDPLLIYKLESFNLFDQLLVRISEEIVTFLSIGKLPIAEETELKEAKLPESDAKKLQTGRQEMGRGRQMAPGRPANEPIRVEKKVGRNDPCPCGSGKKYKNCHGRLEAAE